MHGFRTDPRTIFLIMNCDPAQMTGSEPRSLTDTRFVSCSTAYVPNDRTNALEMVFPYRRLAFKVDIKSLLYKVHESQSQTEGLDTSKAAMSS